MLKMRLLMQKKYFNFKYILHPSRSKGEGFVLEITNYKKKWIK